MARKKKNQIDPEQFKHAVSVDVALNTILGVFPYAQTAIVILDVTVPNMKFPSLMVRSRGTPMSRAVLLRVVEKLEEHLADLKKNLEEEQEQHG